MPRLRKTLDIVRNCMSTLRTSYNDFEILLLSETLYSADSIDNSKTYDQIHQDGRYDNYLYLTRHGIKIFKDDEQVNSALVVSNGGIAGINKTSSLIDNHKLLICCGHSVFCLTLPDLYLSWRTIGDSATCFEIFKHQNDFIIHSELEISKHDNAGQVIWSFSGDDIFTTVTGQNDFKIIEDIVHATNWENSVFEIDAKTGILLRKCPIN